MKQLVRYTCEGEVWTAFTFGDGGPSGSEDVIEHHHHGDPHTIHSVTEVPEGMLVYTVTSQFEDGDPATDIFMAKDVEDAARQTYEHWRDGLFLGSEIGSETVTIHKIEMGENPCAHLERVKVVEE
jgi:hypothetical protein